MMKKLLFTTLVLLLGYLSGGNWAMAQNGWEALKTQEQTISPEWEKISESSTDGKVLGSAGVTSYYCVTKTLNFTNDRTDNGGKGNSGMKILGTVYLYLPAGVSITCRGANADGRTGAGAGIELSEGNTLYIIGGGEGTTVTAIGGNAENGRNGGTGTDAYNKNNKLYTGTGGKGGQRGRGYAWDGAGNNYTVAGGGGGGG